MTAEFGETDENRGYAIVLIVTVCFTLLGDWANWWQSSYDGGSETVNSGSGFLGRVIFLLAMLLLMFGAIALASESPLTAPASVTVALLLIVSLVIATFVSRSANLHLANTDLGFGSEISPAFGLIVSYLGSLAVLTVSVRSVFVTRRRTAQPVDPRWQRFPWTDRRAG